MQDAKAAFGGLDILVQNAGIYPWTLIENISPEEWDAVCAVNLKGTFLAARAALGRDSDLTVHYLGRTVDLTPPWPRKRFADMIAEKTGEVMHPEMPLDDARAGENVRACIDLVMARPQWRLSLQTHKLLGLR